MLKIGTVVGGRYRVLRKLGRGGTGIVYLALDERSNRTWAIKIIGRDRDAYFGPNGKTLMAEADILKGLHHRYLPAVAEIVEDGDFVMIVMEYIEGRTLKEMLEENMRMNGSPLPVEEVERWAGQLCEVLNYLHTNDKPVIYGDLKPGNVMIRPDGGIALVDFGTVRLFERRNEEGAACLGTPGFAAPEQYGGRRLGPWTDIYSFGATLHCLLTGRDPAQMPFCFPAILECCPEMDCEISDRQREKLARLDRIIKRCTCNVIEERYGSCGELARELAAIGDNGEKEAKGTGRRKIVFIVCLCAVIMSEIMALCGFFMKKRARNMEYALCIEKAEMADTEERTELLRRAVCLDPWREQAYMDLLDTLLEDGSFSGDDEKLLTELIYAREEERQQDNRSCLQENRSGYILFSYKMGMACYCLSPETGGRIRARAWLQNVADADMDRLNLGEYDDFKRKWQTRAAVLVRFSSYYEKGLKGTKNTEDTVLFQKCYWEDLKTLLAGLMEEDFTVIELGLSQDIVMRLLEGIEDFREAGVERREIERMLDEITDRMSEAVQGQLEPVGQMKKNIEQAVESAKKGIIVVYGESGGKEYDGE